VPGRASGVKMVGMAEVGTPISLDGVAFRDCWCICLFFFTLYQKIQMAKKDDLWVLPRGCPMLLRKQEVRKPSQNAAQPCARAQGYVNDDLRADGLWKGWRFWIGTWNVDSLTGKSGEVVEALLYRKVDVACIHETQWKGSDCKLYGTKGKRYKLFWMGGE